MTRTKFSGEYQDAAVAPDTPQEERPIFMCTAGGWQHTRTRISPVAFPRKDDERRPTGETYYTCREP